MKLRKNWTSFTRAMLTLGLALQLCACVQDSGSSASAATPGTSTVTTTSSGGTTTTGSFNLTWTAPVTRSDGTPLPLSEIAGYRVYYGNSLGNYPNSVNINNGTLQSATLTGIPVGTYYIAMTTYDTNGMESSYSSPVVKKAL